MSQYQSYSQRNQGGASNQGTQGSQGRGPTGPTTTGREQFTGTNLSGGFQQGGITNFQQGNIGDQAVLTWAGIDPDNVVVSSDSDYNRLSNLKNILLMLQTEFAEGGAKVIFTGEKKDDFNKRLLLIEHEIDGLLKRKINYAARD